jgi:VanZ family protein
LVLRNQVTRMPRQQADLPYPTICSISVATSASINSENRSRSRRVGPDILKIVVRTVLGSRRPLQFASGACLGTLAVLSLLPAEQITRSSLGGHFEHVIAYAGTAFVCTAALRGGARPQPAFFALLAYAGALELLQRYSPGRVSSLGDYIFSGTGILVGVSALMMVRAWSFAQGRAS